LNDMFNRQKRNDREKEQGTAQSFELSGGKTETPRRGGKEHWEVGKDRGNAQLNERLGVKKVSLGVWLLKNQGESACGLEPGTGTPWKKT